MPQSNLIDVTTREAREALSEPDKKRFREAKTTAYSKAQTKVREDHLAEFNEIQRTLLAEDGFDWKPELTEKEKAALEFDRLLTEYPDFAERVQAHEEAQAEAGLTEEEQAEVDAELAKVNGVEDAGVEPLAQPEDPTYPTPKAG